MTTRYRVAGFEINGTELDFNVEVPLDADNVFLNVPGIIADNVRDAFTEVSNGGTGYHAGFYCILAGTSYEVSINKQMRVKGSFKLAGTIVVNGQLVID